MDLICRDRRAGVLVFVEVKTRRNELFGPPHLAITRWQELRIFRAAKEWLRLLDDQSIPYRFDVVEVIGRKSPEIRLIRNAFTLGEDIYT